MSVRPGGNFINLDSFDYRQDTNDASKFYLQASLLKPFGFQLKDGRCVYPTDWFCFDGASIPKLCWRWIGPPTGFGKRAAYMPAACIHDWLYEKGFIEDRYIDRQLADRIFYVACRRLHVSMWRCKIMYTCLRIGAKSHWDEHKHPAPGTPK